MTGAGVPERDECIDDPVGLSRGCRQTERSPHRLGGWTSKGSQKAARQLFIVADLADQMAEAFGVLERLSGKPARLTSSGRRRKSSLWATARAKSEYAVSPACSSECSA